MVTAGDPGAGSALIEVGRTCLAARRSLAARSVVSRQTTPVFGPLTAAPASPPVLRAMLQSTREEASHLMDRMERPHPWTGRTRPACKALSTAVRLTLPVR